jgi:hypothetical protein
VAETLDRNGYTGWHKVYSGNVEGKPRGVVPLEETATAFRYSHTLERLGIAALLGGPPQVGFWTVQLRESKDAHSKVLFEQSVQLGVTSAELAGLAAWYVHESYTYKFKTRICDGQFLSPLVEPHYGGHSGNSNPMAPGVVRFWNVKVTTMTVKAPVMPSGAVSMDLQWSRDRYENFEPFAVNVASEASINLNVSGLGISSGNRDISATELVWVRAVARGADGIPVPGDAVRDTWPTVFGTTQVRGYEGWRYVDIKTRTVFSEQSLIQNPGGSGVLVVRVHPEWGSPSFGYNCHIPVGAYWDIISDYWVGTLSNNDIYYSLAWKPGGVGAKTLRDSRLGSQWVIKPHNLKLNIARQLTLNGFAEPTQFEGTVYDGPLRNYTVARDSARLVALVDPGFGARGFVVVVSKDEGQTWKQYDVVDKGHNMTSNTELITSAYRDNKLIVYGRATVDFSGPTGGVAYEEKTIKEGDVVRMVLTGSKQATSLATGEVVNVEKWEMTSRTRIIPFTDGDVLPKTGIISLATMDARLLLTTQEGTKTVLRISKDDLATVTRVDAV